MIMTFLFFIIISLIICTTTDQGTKHKGCPGLPKEQLDGTNCEAWDLDVDCGGSFPPGTNLYFKCDEFYVPSQLHESGQNSLQVTRCLNGEWSYPEFNSFRCIKEPNWYCSQGWVNAGSTYSEVHYQLMVVMYVLGFTTNIVNLAVLTRKSMKNPLNTILTALALADFIFILNGLVTEALRLYRADHGDSRSSYQQAVEDLISRVAYYLFHTWSIYLTLLVAVWRFVGIWFPFQSRRWCVGKTAKWAVFSFILFGTILLVIIYGGTHIEKVEEAENEEYQTGRSDLAKKLLFWTYAIFVKLVPCSLLTFFTLGMIWGLMRAKENRRKLKEFSIQELETTENEKTRVEFDRTTKTLLVILIIFLVTEIPDGIVSILHLVLSPRFSKECLEPTVNFCLFFEQMSCVSSMFVYLIMSQSYRDTLCDIIFVRKPKLDNIQKYPVFKLTYLTPS